jgi:hypothetical protein
MAARVGKALFGSVEQRQRESESTGAREMKIESGETFFDC